MSPKVAPKTTPFTSSEIREILNVETPEAKKERLKQQLLNQLAFHSINPLKELGEGADRAFQLANRSKVVDLASAQKEARTSFSSLRDKIDSLDFRESFCEAVEFDQRTRMTEHMLDVRVAAAAMTFVGDLAVDAVTKVCHTNPTTEAFCQKAKEVIAQQTVRALDATHLKEPLKEGVKSYAQFQQETFPSRMKEECGVSEEFSKQYVLDATAVAIGLIPIPGLKKAKNALVPAAGESAIKRGVRSISSPAAISGQAGLEITTELIETAYRNAVQSSPKSLPLAAPVVQAAAKNISASLPASSMKAANSEMLWGGVVRASTKPLPKGTVTYFAKGEKVAARIGKDFVIRQGPINKIDQVFNELADFQFYRSIRINQSTFPEPIVLGGHPFLKKIFLERKTFATLLERVADFPQNSALRMEALHSLAVASQRAGQEMGRWHQESLSYPQIPPTPIQLDQIANQVLGKIDRVNERLRLSNLPPLREVPHLQKTIEEFKRFPGPMVFALDDMPPDQITGSLSTYGTKSPTALLSREYHKFNHIFDVEGPKVGLVPREIIRSRQAYYAGWAFEYGSGPFSDAADRLYTIEHLFDVFEDIPVESLKNEFYIKMFNETLNQLD